MKVTQEKLPDSQIGLEIEIPAETGKKAYETKVNTLARTANIPGFRKGKVPRPILLQRLGTRYIKAVTLEELVQKTLEKALEQESINSIGNYTLRSSLDELVENFKPGEPFTFSASVDVPPTLELGDYQTLSIKAEETVYDPQQLEDWFKERQEKLATLVPVEDRGAEMGDVAIVDYKGVATPEGEEEPQPIEGVEGTDFRVDLEEGKFIEGMVEGIVGMKPEETKELPLTFPDDYPREDLAGKPVTFTITLKELKAKELPELDDDFAEEVSEYETIAELRESLEKQFKESVEDETKQSIHTAITSELSKVCTVDLPDTLVQDEVSRVLTQTAMQMEQMGIDLGQLFTQENLPKLRENARPEAIERLKQTLILQEIAKVESITLEEAEIEERSNEIKEQLQGQEVDPDKLRDVVEEQLTTEKTLNWLQEKATVELVPKGTLEAENKAETEEGEEQTETETEE
ncbi:trigger factor [Crocosphaera sp.]|uniref:trigger factor n=1 Tax=Crocosphaera sp. TaxID=2729996 RepID=UPI003F211D56|nr:trigger factor [Crocosphaera sp.]